MRPIRRILVAIKDPTAKSLPAVAKGAQLALALGAELELFHCISTPMYVDAYSPGDSLSRIEQDTHDKRLKQLESIAKKLRGENLEVNVSATWDFPVYEAIVRRASSIGATLIIADRHAKSHTFAGLLKLTDWELLRMSQVPVLLVKDNTPYKLPVILAAVDPAHTCSKPAKLDEEILQLAKTVSQALRGSLHAVHAYIPCPPGSMARSDVNNVMLKKLQARTAAAAKRGFERAVRSARIPKSHSHLLQRHPINAIEQVARETRTAIVVMGAISRSGLQRFFFGNTAEALLDSLKCDLLIVKPASFAARVPKQVRGVRFSASAFTPGL
jgi:universal stress protein E